jgi:hypothetical protein
MIVIRRYGEDGGRMYRLTDFYSAEDEVTQVRVDDLRFERFIDTLIRDVAYVAEEDIIWYEYTSDEKILISNEQVWRAALWDMYSQGERRFKFKVQREKR